MKNNLPKVLIIIVNTNGGKHIFDCLDSLRKVNYLNYSTVVVDNNSSDGSPEKIEKEYKKVRLIKNSQNLGFTGANNKGIRYAMSHKADYILLLNDDTIVDQSFIKELVKEGENNPEIGVLGCRIYYASDPQKLWFGGGKINKFRGSAEHITNDKKSKQKFFCDFITGCAFCIKREVVERIGYLDNNFFIYCEDLDYCIRAINAGFKILYVPTSIVWHKISRTSKGKSFFYYYLTNRNILYLYRKFKDKRIFFNPLFYLFFREAYLLIKNLLILNFSQAEVVAKSFLMALRDNRRQTMGKPEFI